MDTEQAMADVDNITRLKFTTFREVAIFYLLIETVFQGSTKSHIFRINMFLKNFITITDTIYANANVDNDLRWDLQYFESWQKFLASLGLSYKAQLIVSLLTFLKTIIDTIQAKDNI